MRCSAWAAVGLLALWGVGWLGLPPLLKWQGEKIATEQLGRDVRIGKVQFSPWTLELTLNDVRIARAANEQGAGEGDWPQFSVKRVYADADMQSLLRLAPVIDALQIDEPVLRLAHTGEGHYDVDDILARLAARAQPAKSGEPARFALYNIEVRDGQISFDDKAAGRVHEVRDLRLTLPFVSSLPSAREVRVQPHLAFVANGSAFDSRAQALPFADSRQTEASFKLDKLDLAPYLGYMPAGMPVRLQAATVDAELRLDFEQTPQPSLRLSGVLTVNGLKSVDTQGADVLAFDALTLELADVRPLQRKLHLSRVELNGPQLTLRRDRSGWLNVLKMPDEQAGQGVRAFTAAVSAEKTSAASAEAAASAPAPALNVTAPAWQVQVDRFALHGGVADVTDDTPAEGGSRPAALRLNTVELAAERVFWPLGPQPLGFSGSATLAGVDRPASSLNFEGQLDERGAQVSARMASVPLALAEPYMAAYLVPRLTGLLDAQFGLQWTRPAASDQQSTLKMTAESLKFSQLVLADGAAGAAHAAATASAPAARGRDAGPLGSVQTLTLSDVQLDWTGRAVTVGKLALQAPQIHVVRGADQRWMYESWLRQPAGQTSVQPVSGAAASAPWKVKLAELAVVDATVDWRDAVPATPVRAEFTQLRLEAKQIDLQALESVPLTLVTRVGAGQAEPGRLSWRGTVGMQPALTVQGQADAQRLPVHAFEPYFGDALNIDILRADTSFKGQMALTQTPQGLRAHIAGDALVQELRTHSHPGSSVTDTGAPAGQAVQTDAASSASVVQASSQAPLVPGAASTTRSTGLGEELLSFKQLRLMGLNVQLAPGAPAQVEVKDTLLSDFYARLIVHSSGRINLQDIFKSSAADASAASATPAADKGGGGDAVVAAPVASEGQGQSAPYPAAAPDPNAPIIRFGPVRLAGGRVFFSDRFIRPNYSADLSDLNGTLSAFSSIAPEGVPQMADLNLTGRAEGSAALEIKGKLNPLAKPLALDIQAKVVDLELPPLSPYSVKYAGHGIERGKLSMDVAYAVQPDGRLSASNKLVLNQLSFGEPVADAPASLPVKLATALLADSKGVIDLDLPISGSLNDPQFSIGPIIFKAIVNLIGRAITAPFTLLASALGGGEGDDMSHIAFAPGSAELDDAARGQLDKIAKALVDRPQLKLTVVGSAYLAQEHEGFQRERLKALVAAEKRAAAPAPKASASESDTTTAPTALTASDAASAAALAPAETAQVTEAEYPTLLRRLYRRADLPGKPRNAIGMVRDLPVAEMEQRLMAHIEVTEDAMRQLATQRGVAVKDYLIAQKLPTDRLFLGAARTGQAAQTDAAVASASAPAAAASAPVGSSAGLPRVELQLTAR